MSSIPEGGDSLPHTAGRALGRDPVSGLGGLSRRVLHRAAQARDVPRGAPPPRRIPPPASSTGSNPCSRRGTSLAIGVARHQLIVAGTATDPRNALLSDLARRLHRHRIATVRFERGVSLEEIDDLLAGWRPTHRATHGPFGLRPARAPVGRTSGSSRPSSPACSCRTTTSRTSGPRRRPTRCGSGSLTSRSRVTAARRTTRRIRCSVARAIDAQPEQVGVRPSRARLPGPDRRRDVGPPGRLGAADARAGLAAGHLAQARNASPRARGRLPTTPSAASSRSPPQRSWPSRR